MRKVRRDKKVYMFDKDNKPAIEVEVGEIFMLETQDAQDGKVTSPEQILYDGVDLDHVNPCTGPVYVKGAEPGDTVVVEIIDIECVGNGFVCILPDDGVLRDYTKPYTHIFNVKGDKAIFDDNLEIPIKPLIGTIGTTPLEPIPTGRSGIYGGNFDSPTMGAGAKLYLPVFVPGALVQAGDCHAAQGDSEFSMGLEISTNITMKITEVIKGVQIPGPIIERADTWATIATGDTIAEAVVEASKNMADFIIERLDISMSQAAVILSCAGNLKFCQAAGIDIYTSTIRMEIPKTIDKLGRLDSF